MSQFHSKNKMIDCILLFCGIENSRGYIKMQKAPTRGHRALSNKMSQPNDIIACKIHREENERKT